MAEPDGVQGKRSGAPSSVVVIATAAQIPEQALAGPGRGLGHAADGADERVRRPVP